MIILAMYINKKLGKTEYIESIIFNMNKLIKVIIVY